MAENKDIKVLLVPDVHGRDFWAEPIMANLNKEIIFLGDYLDPYPQEGISKERAIEVFNEILGLARDNNNITLLIGNHDAGYCLHTGICQCRHDWHNHEKIAHMFLDNFDLFSIAKEKTINKKRFFFSHAGVNPSWIKYDSFIFHEDFRPTANNFNNLLRSEDAWEVKSFINALSDVSYYRGGYESYGSMLWADIREFIGHPEIKKRKTIQVVGHTMLNGAALRLGDNLYCLDCKKVFYIDSKGIIRYYDTDEEVERHDTV